MASYFRACHNVWLWRGLPLAMFQRRMCSLLLPSCEPIIKCSAYEAGIYFKLLCQYFCLKASLIPCEDFVEAFYHCFLFEFDLAAFLPDFVFCRMAALKAFWLGWGVGSKVALWIAKPGMCLKGANHRVLKASEKRLQLSCVHFVTLEFLKIATMTGVLKALDSNVSEWNDLTNKVPLLLWSYLQVQCLCRKPETMLLFSKTWMELYCDGILQKQFSHDVMSNLIFSPVEGMLYLL